MTVCLCCSKTFKPHRNSLGKYCSNLCQKKYEYQKQVKLWLSGSIKGYTGKAKQTKAFVRKYLFETRGAKCENCGWDKVHPIDNKPLVEINHIDGDSTNDRPSNLEILCPNCHSMTINFRARNKKSTRKR